MLTDLCNNPDIAIITVQEHWLTSYSNMFLVLIGTRQGGVISPALFNIFTLQQ